MFDSMRDHGGLNSPGSHLFEKIQTDPIGPITDSVNTHREPQLHSPFQLRGDLALWSEHHSDIVVVVEIAHQKRFQHVGCPTTQSSIGKDLNVTQAKVFVAHIGRHSQRLN